MKKNFLATAFVAASLFTFTAFAAPASDDNKKECPKTECGSKKCDGDKKVAPNRPNPFEGLNLTTEQQNKLNALTEAQKTKRQADAEKQKADKQAQREQRKADRQNSQREYLNSIKTILTPEQYTAFLENIVLNQPRDGKGPRFGQGPRGSKGPGFGQEPRPGQGPKDFKHGDKKMKKDGDKKADKKDKKDKKDTSK
jgi:Spy/CpxP family protein refolding chaperone